MDQARSLPSGTVTFLFTDIEGSTKLWEQHPNAMRLALARHDAILRRVIESHGGHVFKTIGDAFCAAFATAPDALGAALAAQRALHAEVWGEVEPLRVRVALHAGAAEQREGDYFGPPLNRVARLLEVAHGGQILLSQPTADLARDSLSGSAGLRDLGEHRLKDLARPEHIFQLLHLELPAEFPPLHSLDALPNNLPLQVTSFIGREREIEEVRQLLEKTRLLTLTGAGGTGKTRLALQVAADHLREYSDGVWLVELASLSDPGLMPQTVASVLDVREAEGAEGAPWGPVPGGKPLTQTLVAALKPRKLLLVLDNCEHLLEACAALAEALLRSCPDVHLLATSREGLNIPGETPYRLRSLSVPDPQHLPATPESLTQYEAVQLFIDRATTVAPSFSLTNANAPAVAQVCHRLDGIPLAIELAASRVKALPVEQLNERLADMFRLLTGGSRTALPRQQTLRALIDWSYDLLSATERTLLRRLSVFSGGWTLEAAEAVCTGDGIEEWDVLDVLTSLVDKSVALYEERGGEGRYRLLETVRQYAWDRLLQAGEAEDVRGRHRDWCLAMAEQAEAGLPGESGRVWLDRLEREHDNLRAALAWSEAEGQAQAGLRLGGALREFWYARGYWTEGREHLAGLLALPGAETRTAARAKALHGAGVLAWQRADDGAARVLQEESLAIFRELGHKPGIAASLLSLGMVAQYREDYRAAWALFEESQAIFRELEDKQGIASSLGGLGWAAHVQGDYAAARALYEESLEICCGLGNKQGIAWSLQSLGGVTYIQGDHGEARARIEESLAIFRELDQKPGIAHSLMSLGWWTLDQGHLGEARALYEESLEIFRELGAKGGIAQDLEELAAVAAAQAQPERAARLLGAAEGLRDAIGGPPPDRAKHERSVAAVRAALGEEAFAAAWAEGRVMPLDAAIEYALDEPGADIPPQ
jgi:predicted ATPase/class 3 adenylate cyclase